MKRALGKIRRLGYKLTRPIRQRFFPKAANLNSESGRASLAPHARRPVVIVAHPDDEFFCSGLICFLRETFQSEITILNVTDGGGGGSRLANADEPLHAIRKREMQRACETLGIHDVRCLGFEDPKEDSAAFHASARDVAKAISDLCAEVGPTLAITHGINGEYWHPAHTVTRRAVRMALPQTPLLTLCAYDPEHPYPLVTNRDDPAHYRLEVDRYFETRLAALREHASQSWVFENIGKCSLEDYVKNIHRESYRFFPPARVA